MCDHFDRTQQGIHERKLLNDLMEHYNPMERPVLNESEPVFVSFGLTLQQIIDVDEKNQLIVTNIMINMEWIDANLRWNVSEYGGVSDIRLAAAKVWKPDILLYNSADERIDSSYPANVEVRQNGSCAWLPPGIYRSTCKIDITWFPFDDQQCKMKFGSWSYQGDSLDLRLMDEQGGDLSTYIVNGEWILLGMPGVRNNVTYACCPSQYIDLTYTILIRRRTLYYGFNLIVPCMIISSMVLLGFTLPPESGEKLTLGVTILLSMSVFMLQLTDILPPTSESVSIIGTYFACIMMVVACSVVMTVVVLNFHHKTQESNEMNKWVRLLVLTWLAWILRMRRPGDISPPKKQASPSSNPKASPLLPMKEDLVNLKIHSHQGKDYPIDGINSTAIDYEDDYLQLNSLRSSANNHANNATNSGFFPHTPSHAPPSSVQLNPSSAGGGPNVPSNLSPSGCCDEIDPIVPVANPSRIPLHQPIHSSASASAHPWTTGTSGLPGSTVNHSYCPGSSSATHSLTQSSDISAILKELRFITNRIRKEDEIQDIIQDWKFAGMVMDRLCLIVFTAFTIISTVICLSSAPHLIV
uniref:Uncharacterized protein n=1 Tax=Tetranychus urticae TaxID=32264 RepID=T1K349_TETUR